ncbi:Ig domain-containing protein group 1 domain-containing protein [Halorhabdus tiamatea SARL4B]|uniref:Ig domain-containing protein group 1 domain-containing protein n=1 Tax=Halorhabdus tiamatea SARL4B TaxID=1033806 RepID=F7PHU8_9EURY|nr:hypothetical protein [Halorhabdus tiamatea]ERJ06942.1 Ig domain-containing protein group 1 domain-containing protein [Halorhabdus tiamatea SARL4B]CCQ32357.1 conserved hypothetical protein [Halorhabdus tiamatea SARL4B]
MRRRTGDFAGDERAIEGLPIRLVIALVVGVAALSLMMNVLGQFDDSFQDETVTVEFSDELVKVGETTNVSVVTSEGDPVEGAHVLVRSGSLTLVDEPMKLNTTNGSAKLDIISGSPDRDKANIDFRSDQNRGSLEFEVIPPSDSDYKATDESTEVVIYR